MSPIHPDPAWIAQAQAWVDTHLEPTNAAAVRARWAEHGTQERPVITLLGPYDSGKSAIVRRLLVDRGLAVPEWVSISARHETFEVNEVPLGPVTLRDTPGITPESDGLRDQANTERALYAAAVTDVLWVVVHPQLANGEVLPELHRILAQPWPDGALSVVISCFDLAGVSAEDDPTGYSALAERKVTELRDSLGLAPEIRVHVVAPDAFGLMGKTRQPPAAAWDAYRAWDGMAALAESVDELDPDRLPDLRLGAEHRLWQAELQRCIHTLGRQRDDLATAAQAAGAEAGKRAQRLDEITTLGAGWTTSAGEVVTRLAGKLSDAKTVGLDSTLVWWTHELEQRWKRVEEDLHRIAEDVDTEHERRRSSTSWATLLDVADALSGPDEDDGPNPMWDLGIRRTGPMVSETSKALKKLQEEFRKRTSDYSNTPKTWSPGRAGGFLDKVELFRKPLTEAFNLTQEYRAMTAGQRATEALRKKVDDWYEAEGPLLIEQLAAVFTENARPVLELIDDRLRAAADTADELNAQVAARNEAISEGEKLLSPAGG